MLTVGAVVVVGTVVGLVLSFGRDRPQQAAAQQQHDGQYRPRRSHVSGRTIDVNSFTDGVCGKRVSFFFRFPRFRSEFL